MAKGFIQPGSISAIVWPTRWRRIAARRCCSKVKISSKPISLVFLTESGPLYVGPPRRAACDELAACSANVFATAVAPNDRNTQAGQCVVEPLALLRARGAIR